MTTQFVGKFLPDGSTEYRSRMTGRRWRLQPIVTGIRIWFAENVCFEDVANRRQAIKTIEIDDLL